MGLHRDSHNLQEILLARESQLPFSEFLVLPPGSSSAVLAGTKVPRLAITTSGSGLSRSGLAPFLPSVATQLSTSPLANSRISVSPPSSQSLMASASSSSFRDSSAEWLEDDLIQGINVACTPSTSSSVSTSVHSSVVDSLLQLAQPEISPKSSSCLEDIFEPPAAVGTLLRRSSQTEPSVCVDGKVRVYQAIADC
jgi:hypothetical protein